MKDLKQGNLVVLVLLNQVHEGLKLWYALGGRQGLGYVVSYKES